MSETLPRRTWSVEEKGLIVAQTRVPGISVYQAARRYDVNVNLVFKWLHDPRFCSAAQLDPYELTFVPVEVSGTLPVVASERTSSEVQGTIKIGMANGYQLEISGDYDVDKIV